MFKTYYELAKPGIIYGNALTAVAGFFLASRGEVRVTLLLAMLVGLSFIIGSACVFNNLWDRDIDDRMERTKDRALIRGAVSGRDAAIFATILLVLGSLLLGFYTNPLTLSVALGGFIVYVGLYTPLKRRSVHATLVGAVAGAVPPVVGYTAVTHRFDLGALLLFLILVFWQMPHFYAIAIRRIEDYRAANVPVLPVVKGIAATKVQIFLYVLAFLVAVSLLFVFKFAGLLYFVVTAALGLIWLVLSVRGIYKSRDLVWSRRMFLFSLIVITLMSLAIIADSFLPVGNFIAKG